VKSACWDSATAFQPHTAREEPLSAADDYGADDHLEFVDKTGPDRLRGEFRIVNSDAALNVRVDRPG
jgi:hypothetical protein